MIYPKSLEELIENLKMLPGVGQKTAERYALKIISMEKDDVNDLAKSIKDVKVKIKHCTKCGNLAES